MRHNQALRTPILVLSAVLAFTSGCAVSPDDAPDDIDEVSSELTTIEGFEAGSKTAYAVADVTLGSGIWRFDEALVGASTSDIKTGLKAARIRTSGKITMLFDRTAGAGTVTIQHASFGTDASGSWGLFRSQDQGTTWTQVGSAVATAGGALATATFTVNLAGAIRFEIRKLDGVSTRRINLDNVTITDFSGGGGGGSGASISKHTTLGLPSPSSTSDPNSFLSVKSGYVISYNGSRKVPNWVSWELNTSYLGSTPRQDDFRTDSTLPANVPQASLADYSGSGFDRGHMCPSADRTLTTTANSQTFLLTNMVPQAGNNNRGAWANLETESRNLALQGKELFIISGGVFSASSSTVGNGLVVPDKTWKVIVVLGAVGQGASAVNTNTRVISVMMPNRDSQISLGADWHTFRVSVDSIEAATGFNFLSDVDPAVQAVIEARVDNL